MSTTSPSRIVHTRVLRALSRPAGVLTGGLTATEIARKIYPSTDNAARTAFDKSVDQYTGVYNALRELEMEHRVIINDDSPPKYTITSRGKESHKD